jgi:hypothetical protein
MMVVIQNKNIGHSLVPEVRDLYEPWVEFVVKDAGGKEIYHSGFLKPDGMLDERAHSFTNRPVNMSTASLWTITRSGPFTRWPTTTPSSPAAPPWCATSSAFPPMRRVR